jgi:hypothetical protein
MFPLEPHEKSFLDTSELHEELNMQVIVVPFEAYHKHSKPLLVDNMNEYFIKQIDVSSSKNGFKSHDGNKEDTKKFIQGSKVFKVHLNERLNEMEKLVIIYKDNFILTVDRGEVIIHGLGDPFAGMLQSLEKANFVEFMETISGNLSKGMNLGDGFNFSDDMFLFKFFFSLEDVECMLQSRIKLLDWLHWHFSIT